MNTLLHLKLLSEEVKPETCPVKQEAEVPRPSRSFQPPARGCPASPSLLPWQRSEEALVPTPSSRRDEAATSRSPAGRPAGSIRFPPPVRLDRKRNSPERKTKKRKPEIQIRLVVTLLLPARRKPDDGVLDHVQINSINFFCGSGSRGRCSVMELEALNFAASSAPGPGGIRLPHDTAANNQSALLVWTRPEPAGPRGDGEQRQQRRRRERTCTWRWSIS